MVIASFGDEGFGLWKIIESVMFYVVFLEPCIRGGLSRFLALSIGRKDKTEASRVLATSAVVLLPIVITVSTSVFLLAPVIAQSFKPDNASLAADATRALQILAIASIASSIGGFAAATLQSMRRFDLVNAVGVPILWANLVASLIVLRFGGGLADFALVALIQSLVTSLIYIIFAIQDLFATNAIEPRSLRPKWNKELARFLSNSAVAKLGDLLRDNSTTLLLGWFVSLEAAAAFAAIDALRRIAMQGMVALADTSAPRLAHTLGDESALQQMLSPMLPIMGALSALISVGMAVFGTDFLRIWLGEIVAGQEVGVIVVMLSASMFMDGLRMVIQRSLRVRNNVGIITVNSILEGLLVIGLGACLATEYGMVGVVAVRIGVSITYATILLPLLFAPKAGVSRWEYWLKGVTRPLLVSAVPAMASVIVLRIVEPDNWGTFMIAVIPGGFLLLIALGLFGLGSKDRDAVWSRLGIRKRGGFSS